MCAPLGWADDHVKANSDHEGMLCRHRFDRQGKLSRSMFLQRLRSLPRKRKQEQEKRGKKRNKPVSEELGGDITDGQLAEHDLDAGINQLLELLVEDLPLSVNNGLILLDVINADLGILLLSLQLELNIQQSNLEGVRPAEQ
jgi:hypothetical protein